MKIQIENSNKIVHDAWFKINIKDTLSLTINTEERWVQPDSMQSNDGNSTFFFHKEDDFEKFDTVSLIGESDAEKEMLNRLPFLLANKEQLWYIFPKKEVWDWTIYE